MLAWSFVAKKGDSMRILIRVASSYQNWSRCELADWMRYLKHDIHYCSQIEGPKKRKCVQVLSHSSKRWSIMLNNIPCQRQPSLTIWMDLLHRHQSRKAQSIFEKPPLQDFSLQTAPLSPRNLQHLQWTLDLSLQNMFWRSEEFNREPRHNGFVPLWYNNAGQMKCLEVQHQIRSQLDILWLKRGYDSNIFNMHHSFNTMQPRYSYILPIS